MMNENVIIGTEAKSKVIAGMYLITDAIECTYGPDASNVCIATPYGAKVTKDGKTVAEAVKSNDPYVQAGINIIKEVSRKTADEVGDGSSTVSILTRAIVRTYKDAPNPISLCRSLRQECSAITEYLKTKSKEVDNFDTMKKVATLSANNDPHIGDMIAQAFDKVGKDGLVSFKKGNSVNDYIEYSKGFQIENGFFSPYLINTKENTVELENVYVYISDTKMEEARQVQDIWQKAIDEGKSLLLMAPDFDSSITMLIYRNMFRQNSTMQAGMVISPNFGQTREVAIQDIKAILGESMTCDKVIMTRDTTTFIGYKSSDNLQSRIDDVKTLLETDLSEIEKLFHRKRLASLTGGYATICVGGYSDTEVQTRCDLYEDAIAATACALKEGILPGGGCALCYAPADLLATSISEPRSILLEKFSRPTYKVEECDDPFWKGLDLTTGIEGDLFKLGVVDPFLVVKATLENAVSAATNILTTNCVIVNDYERNFSNNE